MRREEPAQLLTVAFRAWALAARSGCLHSRRGDAVPECLCPADGRPDGGARLDQGGRDAGEPDGSYRITLPGEGGLRSLADRARAELRGT
jgi:hypothetical protein